MSLYPGDFVVLIVMALSLLVIIGLLAMIVKSVRSKK